MAASSPRNLPKPVSYLPFDTAMQPTATPQHASAAGFRRSDAAAGGGPPERRERA